MDIKLGDGNIKLSNKIKTWSLPPIKTCPGADKCRKYCYSLKAWKRFEHVRKRWNKNWKATKKDGFVNNMKKLIKSKNNVNAIRIHVAGDFYSQKYFDKWCRIADDLDETFLAFTKTNLDVSNKPNNLILFFSFDYTPPGYNGQARVIENLDNVRKDEHLCPYGIDEVKQVCGTKCKYCYQKEKNKKVVFKKH